MFTTQVPIKPLPKPTAQRHDRNALEMQPAVWKIRTEVRFGVFSNREVGNEDPAWKSILVGGRVRLALNPIENPVVSADGFAVHLIEDGAMSASEVAIFEDDEVG